MTTQAKPKGKARKAPPHFTREFQQWARSHVRRESCVINGAKGFSATLAKHGADVAFHGARQWRLDHPSSNELLMMGILSLDWVSHTNGSTDSALAYTRSTFTCPPQPRRSRSTAVFTHSSTWRSESVSGAQAQADEGPPHSLLGHLGYGTDERRRRGDSESAALCRARQPDKHQP